MTTTEDIQKAVAEIEERYDGKFIDSQAFADVKALLFAAKALLSSAATDREIIQRQAKMIEELTAERDRYLKALESVLHRLETNRIWDGLKWEYLNIPPINLRACTEDNPRSPGEGVMPYLTPAELAAIQVLPHDTPYLIEGVLNGQFSIVRFYGGCKFNGRQYTYDEAHNVLVRDDVAWMLTRIRRKPRTKGPETEEMFP